MAIVSTICSCGAKIRHNEEDIPKRCVCCKKKLVSADDVIIVAGKNAPTIVTPEPAVVKGKAKEAN